MLNDLHISRTKDASTASEALSAWAVADSGESPDLMVRATSNDETRLSYPLLQSSAGSLHAHQHPPFDLRRIPTRLH